MLASERALRHALAHEKLEREASGVSMVHEGMFLLLGNAERECTCCCDCVLAFPSTAVPATMNWIVVSFASYDRTDVSNMKSRRCPYRAAYSSLAFDTKDELVGLI